MIAVIFLIINILYDIGVGVLSGFILGEVQPLYYLIITQATKLILVAIFVRKRTDKYKEEYNEEYIKTKSLNKDAYKLVTIGLGLAGFGNILVTIIMKLFESNPYINNVIETLNQALSFSNNYEYALMILSVVLLAPILEEYLFRGILFAEVKKSPKAKIIITALTFAIYHLNLIQGLNTLFIGLVLGYIYYYRRNIKEVILVHMVNNLVAVFPVYNEVLGIICIIAIGFAIKFLMDFRKE
ncbi:CPBP family intramembrane glutamic endopeptidase [Anaerococcus marasmi]|uniref:CPBP family intramembrane glutamic endopeptidase n=1 Tax=Anaerococcus marasmi TaxID=2057797 RepID=UPI000CF88743|nr:CPBP family intramembrane glutamic endopeptidase [Anaerococcus marasmi]